MGKEVTSNSLEFSGIRVEIRTPVPFDDVLGRLRKLCGKTTVPEVVALAKEDITEQQYVSEVEKRFVGKSGFMLFGEIDHGGWIGKFGIKRRSLRWILGNPLIAITMIRHDITAGLFAPVELLLTESVDDDGCFLTYVRPSSLILIEENEELEAAARALDKKFEALVSAATKTV
ncbi:uncharacterized protein (DUF302 family) [Paraburkholderia sp. GAS199]|uniref:DUF302 domain-containing protein n=1 Tax=Paraburkholderia sp. GAS199 TaxID=3035126 RepID=UPI003D1EB5CE